MRRRHIFRTETQMRAIIREIETGQLSKAEAQRKYKFQGNGNINYWIAKFGEASKPISVDYDKLSKEELIKLFLKMNTLLNTRN